LDDLGVDQAAPIDAKRRGSGDIEVEPGVI
jgi:hypothetical protein